jgi:hypothetical protein
MQSKEKRGQLAETWRPGRDLQLHVSLHFFFPPPSLSHECLLQVLRFSDLGPALGFFGGDLVLEESDIELFGDGSLPIPSQVNDAVMQLVRPASS